MTSKQLNKIIKRHELNNKILKEDKGLLLEKLRQYTKAKRGNATILSRETGAYKQDFVKYLNGYPVSLEKLVILVKKILILEKKCLPFKAS